MAPPLTTSLPAVHHGTRAEQQQETFQTQKRSPCGLWVPGEKQCSWQSITERLPAFVWAPAPAQAQSAGSGSPEGAEAGLQWGAWGRGLRNTYERQRIQPGFPPSAHHYLRAERCNVFQRQFRKYTFLSRFSLFHPTPSINEPGKTTAQHTRQSDGSVKRKINLSFHTKIPPLSIPNIW